MTVAGRSFASVRDAARHYRVPYVTAARRLREGWSAEQAFNLDPRARRTPGRKAPALITSVGTFRTIKEAAAIAGTLPGTLGARLRKGWTPDEALGASPRQRKRKITRPIECDGVTYPNLWVLADHYSLNHTRVYKRIKSGWTPEQAVELVAPPPRFRNQVGGARTRHWKDVQILDGKALPVAPVGNFKLYVIRNRINNREYVGITITPLDVRLRGHRANARKGVKNKLYNAMRHYGADNFAVELIRSDARNFAELQQQEIDEIRIRDTLKRGYNVSPGGAVGTPDAVTVAGVTYASHAAAAEHFGIDASVFNLRVARLKWTPEQAAELEPRPKFARRKVTVAGHSFRSLKAAAEHFAVPYQRTRERVVRNGWSLEQAFGLAKPPESVKFQGEAVAAFGETFPSLASCARRFGIKAESLRQRVRLDGEPLEQAITNLQRKPKAGAQPHPVRAFGRRFQSIADCAAHHGISVHTLRNRLRYQGDTLEAAIAYLTGRRETRK